MKRDEFLKQVQSVAQLDSREEAERATRATFEVLAERIVGDEAKDLASQLPQELGQYLRGREGENGQAFSLKEFYQRVADKEGVEPNVAAMHVRAVFTVLQQGVTPGEFADVRANFSPDYEELFAVTNIS
ncbi:DUF2267 domain-containing protein [Microseira wollei]|uniref:DUF2267 domain-containing protein n=1 Tax=Microseira wollei NIES-4236 TaxID=2530354 RepID=A0AAV3X9T9_9CYAN|nr:DUF2267 domain-containing protein [Microseira wollei]GET38136.1 hypothetical protein MiSe_28900 [Microseira wollei NIES-4236]